MRGSARGRGRSCAPAPSNAGARTPAPRSPPRTCSRNGPRVDCTASSAGSTGATTDATIVCPAAPVDGGEAACVFGDPSGPTYDEDVATEVAALRTQVAGPSPVYAVEEIGDGCFALAQLRSEPRAAFGTEARFCFDEATGAPTDSRVRYAGGIVEVLATSSVTSTVRDSDLEP